jgi:6-phosphogluconolactonase/glucosamine-6-phosphate isomerase/deaminase
MKFLRENQSAAEQIIASVICAGLFAHKRVLWLVSGGSNAVIEKNIMDMVRNHAGGNLTGMAILPMDERYGKPGHSDSNAQQLREIGFNPGNAIWVDVLMHDTPLDQTVSFYSDVISAALANASIIVGQFGMGTDGHVAGIKPNSPATVTDESTVAGYEWEDYTRMTLMPAALRQISTAFLLAYGADKKGPLKKLRDKSDSFKKLPAMLLYELTEVSVFNDQIESED